MLTPEPAPRSPLADPALPALADLLDARAARPVLEAALAGAGVIESIRPVQVRHDRGRRVVVRYAVTGRWTASWTAGWSAVQTVVAEHGTHPPLPGTAVVGDGERVVAVWRYPFDPHLPGLAPAAHLEPVRTLVAGLADRCGWDLAPDGARSHPHEGDRPALPVPTAVVPRAYRPTRRAVLQVQAGPAGARTDLCYLKVLRPRRIEQAAAVHRLVGAAVRVPPLLGVGAELGILVLGVARGDVLRDRLIGAGRLPDPAALVALQAALVAAPADGAPAARPAAVDRHADALARLLPDRRGLVERIAAGAEAAAVEDRAAGGPVGLVHGDLYEAQVLLDDRARVADEQVLGVLDLDGAGVGPVLDDCATVLAHLRALEDWRPAAASRIRAWADAYVEATGAVVDPERVRRRAAGVLLGLAGGGFAVQEAGWAATATRRLEAAAALAGGDGRPADGGGSSPPR